MILKIILIAIILYLLYRAFGGKIELANGVKKATKSSSANKGEPKELAENTLVECSECGVYITYKEAIIKKGKIYCEDCFKKVK